MSSFLNALDANVARRELRDYLLSIATTAGFAPADVPHSFDTQKLLGFATRVAGKRDVKARPEVYLELLAKAGVAHALAGDDESALKLLQRGYRAADTNQKKAQYLYHQGYHSEHRRGDAALARKTLEEAYVLSERSRRLRGEILLALGTIEMNLGNLDSAERSLQAALDLHLRELEPHALLRLSDIATQQDRFEEAVRQNRQAHTFFRRRRDWKGQKAADSNLAVLCIEQGKHDEARALLDGVITEGLRVLDISRLGRDYNNQAVLRSQTGNPSGARESVLEAIRYHEASGRRALLIGNYQNLGGYLVQLGETDAGLAAFEEAASIARSVDLERREFQVLAFLLLTAARHRLAFPSFSAVMERCREIMGENAESLAKKSLVNFATAMQEVALRPELASAKRRSRSYRKLAPREGHQMLRALMPSAEAIDFAGQLELRLGEGLPGRDVPAPENVKQFLLQFVGDYFKSGNYTREFGITQERAKRHLRWMCLERLIERTGSRKASRYSLAFHRA